MDKEAFDPGAFTGAAYGSAIGGGIGAYASTVSFSNKLNNKQRMALILAGALSGASAGSEIGATPIRRKKTAAEILTIARALGNSNKVAAYVAPQTMTKIVKRLVDKGVTGTTGKGVLEARLARLVKKEKVQNETLKYSPKHNLNRVADKYLDTSTENLKKIPGIIGKDVYTFGSGLLFTKLVDKLTAKKAPSKLQQFIDASPKYLAGAAAVGAGTYAGNKLAAFKFNPSVIGESSDDAMEVYIMWKAQKQQLEKEKAEAEAAYNSSQKDK
jgi:hypothetical protein